MRKKTKSIQSSPNTRSASGSKIPEYWELFNHINSYHGFKSGNVAPMWQSTAPKLKDRVYPFWQALIQGEQDRVLLALFDAALSAHVRDEVTDARTTLQAMLSLAEYDPRFGEPTAVSIIWRVLENWRAAPHAGARKNRSTKGRDVGYKGRRLDNFFRKNPEFADQIRSAPKGEGAALKDKACKKAGVNWEQSKSSHRAVERPCSA